MKIKVFTSKRLCASLLEMSKTKKQYSFPLSKHGIATENAPWMFIYGFFLFHMAMFGSVGFLLSYSDGASFLANLVFSGFAISIYIVFYIAIFGIDEIKWLIINSIIGLLGIYSQLDWILERFGKTAQDFPTYYHIVPGIYFVLYTFLLRRAALHLLKAKEGSKKKVVVDFGYIIVTLGYYLWSINK